MAMNSQESSKFKRNRRRIANWLLNPSLQLRFGLYSNFLFLMLAGSCAYFIFVSVRDISDIFTTFLAGQNKEISTLLINYLEASN